MFYNNFAIRVGLCFLMFWFVGVWVTLITLFFLVLFLFSLNCFTLVTNDFSACFCGDDFFKFFFFLKDYLILLNRDTIGKAMKTGCVLFAFFSLCVSVWESVWFGGRLWRHDNDDDELMFDYVFFFLLANFIFVVCIFKKLRTKANFSLFFLVCNDVTMCVIFNYWFLLRFANVKLYFYLAV